MIRVFDNKAPQITQACFIADSADVIGNVNLGDESSVWFGCVLRGDVNQITIGNRTNIQDRVVIHVDHQHDVRIGDDVTVGHGAIIHGCHIGNGTLIGMGAIILDGAVIGEGCIIGAGALIPPNKTIPNNTLVMGSPGKQIREVTEQDKQSILDSAKRYVSYAKAY